MGLLGRLLGLFSGGEHRTDATAGRGNRGDPGESADSRGGGAEDGSKAGGHGSHWETVVEGSDEIRATIMETVQAGEPTEGTDHVGYRTGEAVGSLVVADADGAITTGYPYGEGVTHEFVVEDRIVWANGHEAQFTGSLGPGEVSFFPTNFYALSDDDSGSRRVSLAAFAYALGPVEETTITDDDGETYDTAGMAALLPMEGGDVDDYSVQTTVEEVTEREFRDRTVYQLRVPLFRDEDDETDFDVFLYASEHVLDGYVPAVGDDVAGAVWLQGRVEG